MTGPESERRPDMGDRAARHVGAADDRAALAFSQEIMGELRASIARLLIVGMCVGAVCGAVAGLAACMAVCARS